MTKLWFRFALLPVVVDLGRLGREISSIKCTGSMIWVNQTPNISSSFLFFTFSMYISIDLSEKMHTRDTLMVSGWIVCLPHLIGADSISSWPVECQWGRLSRLSAEHRDQSAQCSDSLFIRKWGGGGGWGLGSIHQDACRLLPVAPGLKATCRD